ncbi:hypothetical protein AUC31_06035 [Planococcus rifietoensis]|uniref:Prepilin-type N-terminal cleavage/methylation domain-containing protein n=1 Tax=Planococcus rifietoensis TaxID=200991 RepID=A0A0U2XQI0_9BACL|nr:prepilin-type N-terminal cleavage/methylation domain-containing protein [Planococcus rifietoensis]ALS74808.1 hypothetical protein AUC31_06035 [Planococcus rifietoensis]
MSNQKGITLVELLAAITLLSIVSVLVMSIIIQSQNTYKRNQLTNMTTTEMSLLINTMTRDIRQHPQQVAVVSNVLTISPPNEDPIVYRFDSAQDELKRNNQVVISNVHDFTIAIEEGIMKLELEDSNEKEWTSTIAIRTGGEL